MNAIMKLLKKKQEMKVCKFGGTSVGTVERMKHVATLIKDATPKIVVLSATAGTTNHHLGGSHGVLLVQSRL